MATNELKTLVAFGLSLGELVAGLMNGVGLGDLGAALKTAKLVGPALSNAGAAFSEYANMTDDEAAELEEFVKSEFSIDDASVEAVIESVLKTLIELHSVVKLVFGGKS